MHFLLYGLVGAGLYYVLTREEDAPDCFDALPAVDRVAAQALVAQLGQTPEGLEAAAVALEAQGLTDAARCVRAMAG